MVIQFCLAWFKKGSLSQAFKLKPARSLYEEYTARIARFAPCKTSPFSGSFEKSTGKKIWVCVNNHTTRELSSVELAQFLDRAQASTRTLDIIIGGPNGFSEEALTQMKPDLRWSFGSMTLPHELAAVVATEQIYRAWTIIRKLPYHLGH